MPAETDRLPVLTTIDDALSACRTAQQEFVAGRVREAEAILKAVIARHPTFYAPYVVFGQMAEQLRDFRFAITAYERASELNPGHALAFTRRALLKLRLEVGDPPPARPLVPTRPVVAMTSLGLNGRFGNQLLQYGLVRLYAARVGAQAVFPDWIGRDLFGLNDPIPPDVRGLAALGDAEVIDVLAGRSQAPRANVDVSGYFCGDTRDWAKGRAQFQRCFEPAGKVRAHVETAAAQLTRRGRTLVALHIRHGDYGQGRFWIAPVAWYATWLRAIWAGLDQPVLYIATDDPAVVAAFSSYQPVTAAQLGAPLAGAEFFTDHWVMRQADFLGTSNSTFSGTAALLNRKPVRCFRPDRAAEGLRPFDPWAEKVLLD